MEDFSVIRKVGEGAFSVVYECLEKATQKVFAVKVVDLSSVAGDQNVNWENEIHIHKQLAHKHIVRLVDFFADNKNLYIVMENCPRGTLLRTLTRRQLDEFQIVKLFRQVCLAVAYLHRQRIIMRDIKPENILLDDQFSVKLCDFGWSAFEHNVDEMRLKAGTFEYMAPETLKKEHQSFPSDIWGLGVLLYEMITGREPFVAMGPAGMLNLMVRNQADLSLVRSEAARALLAKMLQYEPDKRPTIAEVLTDRLFAPLFDVGYSDEGPKWDRQSEEAKARREQEEQERRERQEKEQERQDYNRWIEELKRRSKEGTLIVNPILPPNATEEQRNAVLPVKPPAPRPHSYQSAELTVLTAPANAQREERKGARSLQLSQELKSSFAPPSLKSGNLALKTDRPNASFNAPLKEETKERRVDGLALQKTRSLGQETSRTVASPKVDEMILIKRGNVTRTPLRPAEPPREPSALSSSYHVERLSKGSLGGHSLAAAPIYNIYSKTAGPGLPQTDSIYSNSLRTRATLSNGTGSQAANSESGRFVASFVGGSGGSQGDKKPASASPNPLRKLFRLDASTNQYTQS